MINFRDLADSYRNLKRGMIFRSAGPLFGTNFSELNQIQTWIDMRSESEWESCELPAFPKRITIPMELADAEYRKVVKPAPEDWAGMYQRGFERNIIKFIEMLECIRSSSKPILFSCAVGRDRTGVAAAFLLFLLGADRKSILTDYCRTTEAAKLLAEPYFSKYLKPGTSQEEFISTYFRCVPAAIEPLVEYFFSNEKSILEKLDQQGFNQIELDDLRRHFLEA